jgi:hypothetical protein
MSSLVGWYLYVMPVRSRFLRRSLRYDTMYLFQGLFVVSFLLFGNLDPDLERDISLTR